MTFFGVLPSSVAYLLIFLFGLSVGSFFNVVLARLPALYRNGTGRAWAGLLWGRSHCVSCRAVLPWYDLIPVFSFFFLRGKCRFCGEAIALRYPIVELSTALGLILFISRQTSGLGGEDVFSALILMGFVLILFFDYFHFIIPDAVVLILFALALSFYGIVAPSRLLGAVGTGFLLGTLFAILYMVSRGRWIGFGDVKLAALLGFWFRHPVALVVVVAAFWGAALWAVVLLATGRGTGKTALPFGSFLAGASVAAIIFSHELQFFDRLF